MSKKNEPNRKEDKRRNITLAGEPINALHYYINNTKLAHVLVQESGLCETPKDAAGSGVFGFKVTSSSNSRKPVYSYACVFTKQKDVKSEDMDLTAFDLAVADAIDTVWQFKPLHTFSIALIHRIMTGHKSRTLSVKKKHRILSSIEKMQKLHIIIDWTDEAAVRGILQGKTASIIKGAFLDLEMVDEGSDEAVSDDDADVVEAGVGPLRKSYKIKSRMPLYEYAARVRQIIAIDHETFEANDKLQCSEDVILLRRELYRNILTMRSDRNNFTSNTLHYCYQDPSGVIKGLMPEIGINCSDSSYKQKLPDFHMKTCMILDSLVRSPLDPILEYSPLILDYREVFDEALPVGVSIEYFPIGYKYLKSNLGKIYDINTGKEKKSTANEDK